MTTHAPSIAITLYKRCSLVKRVTTLSAEEVAFMPLATAGNDDLPFNGCLAATAAGRKHLMKVKMTVEAQAAITIVHCSLAINEVWRVRVRSAGFDTRKTCIARGRRFRVEGDALKEFRAVEAGEALRVETLREGGDNASSYGKGTGSALRWGAIVT